MRRSWDDYLFEAMAWVLYVLIVFAFMSPLLFADETIPLDGKTVCPAGHRYEPLRLEGPRWVGLCYQGKVEPAILRACSALRCERQAGPTLDTMVETEGLGYPWLYDHHYGPFHRPWNHVHFGTRFNFVERGHHEAHR